MRYYVRVYSMVDEGEEEVQLGELGFSAPSRDEAEYQRAKFAEKCLERAGQSYTSTLWVYDSKVADWKELSTNGVISWL